MIYTVDEWSPLQRVVVGRAHYANWPSSDPVFAQESKKTTWRETPPPSGPVPDWIVAEAEQDLDLLAQTLHSMGIQVERPAPRNFPVTGGMYNYCPRDRFLIHGTTVIDPAMMYPCRDQERECYDYVFHAIHDVRVMPRDQGMILDAANVCRLGDSMLFLESVSGNRAAYDWLCRQFPDIRIELCQFYGGVHIDSTIVPLREGLVMLNASRVNNNNCPEVFRTWEKIYVEDVVARDFYQYPYASKWIGLNVLVIDPKTVVVDETQTELIKTIERHGFNVIPLPMRHSRTLGGGFHCVTLDLLRQ